MQFKIKIIPYTLHFKRPAGTSRGIYYDHKVWYVVVYSSKNPHLYGIGECAPLHDLSCDYSEDYESKLIQFCKETEETGKLEREKLKAYPSILFGLETAFRHYQTNNITLWDTAFTKGEEGIPINGLIWMGDKSYMFEQIKAKLEQGFSCVKLKIGAIDFEEELNLLKYIRSQFSASDITLRVDANGAFGVDEALSKLERLAAFDIHSIEQPIRAGQWAEMADIVQKTPISVALDEELIGIHSTIEKESLLTAIRPHYIILKPSLHGGISGGNEWIELAEKNGIGWWITSALESNIGLNAIAQWCSTFDNRLPQGLGTGMLYTNNVAMPLEIKKDRLWFTDNKLPESLNQFVLQNIA